METKISELIQDLERRQHNAKTIFDRENHPDGNRMQKNENWGKYVAFSYCTKELNEILKQRQDESQSVQHNEVKRKKCDSCGRTEGDTIANEYFCPKCGIYR